MINANNYFNSYLLAGTHPEDFLEINQGADRFILITLDEGIPIEVSLDGMALSMSFFRQSFLFFYHANKEKYKFHLPILVIEPSRPISLKLELQERKGI